jgi:MFS family permease
MVKGKLRGHRDFRLLWGGETVSELGSQVSLLAIPLLAVRTLHATTFQVGLLTAAETAAFLIVGLPAGVWVDRIRRHWVMIAADLGRVLVLGSIPVAYALGALTMVQLIVVTLVTGILTVFFDVAYQSYLPSLVGREHLVEGNAKLTGSAQVATVAGPSIAGGLVQAIGSSYAIVVDSLSFLVSALAVAGIRTPEPKPEIPEGGHPSLRHDMAEGLRFVFHNALLRAIACTTASSNLASGIAAAVEVVFLVRTVHASPAVIGLLFTLGGVGGVLGALVAGPLARRIGGARATIVGILSNVGALLIPLTQPKAGLLFFGIGMLFVGFGATVYNVNQVSFRQRLCPDRLLGRMNATMRFVVWGVLPIGALIGGLLGTIIGLRPTLWIGAAGEAVAGVWLLASPMRSMRDFPEIENPET